MNDLISEAIRFRGITFRCRRRARGLTQAEVAKMLRLSKRVIIAYELGIIMQRPPDAMDRIASLNTKWTHEDLKQC